MRAEDKNLTSFVCQIAENTEKKETLIAHSPVMVKIRKEKSSRKSKFSFLAVAGRIRNPTHV
jgi:hypothetical protein